MRSCLVLSGESSWGLDFVATARWLCGVQRCHHGGFPLFCFLVYCVDLFLDRAPALAAGQLSVAAFCSSLPMHHLAI
ncbi:Os05g0343800 [Oryza sativa Japonica Group]|uniref:Os05g0343800 protein n=1 Tax=Oryza sativa subsp. japonica TaxID=39947 RepID=Q5W6M6_ORYSJ|nr:unknown protein [Oryza sativa Japonica Group]KAF2930297.1 hypothetical protein DAI22_05g124000 [Oryza sativa Japonica Group]BAH93099.1 Os05g0343800 [Oryza sativa Japonica Group]|eukprot:NP_001174371.1 Os05g0343800 [Oryza sativa Japonica Group]